MGRTALNPHSPLPIIGIRDSGVGGLTVARQVRRLLPGIPLLYFADTANVPYGDRTPREIRHFAFSITEFLQQHGANLVIFACNTTSAYALDAAREHFDIPLLGMIEGGAQAAVCALNTEQEHPTIGVLATSATVESGVYSRHLTALRPDAHCIEVPCPLFVPLVEEEKMDSNAAFQACEKALSPLIEAKADAVILGCTHFPLLLPTLQEVAPELRFIDPAQAVAIQAQQLIKSTFGDRDILTEPQDTYFASGSTDTLHRWITTLMEPSSPFQIHSAPIFRIS